MARQMIINMPEKMVEKIVAFGLDYSVYLVFLLGGCESRKNRPTAICMG